MPMQKLANPIALNRSEEMCQSTEPTFVRRLLGGAIDNRLSMIACKGNEVRRTGCEERETVPDCCRCVQANSTAGACVGEKWPDRYR